MSFTIVFVCVCKKSVKQPRKKYEQNQTNAKAIYIYMNIN